MYTVILNGLYVAQRRILYMYMSDCAFLISNRRFGGKRWNSSLVEH